MDLDDPDLGSSLTGSKAPAQVPLTPNDFYAATLVRNEEHMSFLSYTFASCNSEDLGTALVDTAAQHGLIGRDTLARHDQFLRERFQLRVQYTQMSREVPFGECVDRKKLLKWHIFRFVSGVEVEFFRVQVVPGGVPCLLPAYTSLTNWARRSACRTCSLRTLDCLLCRT